MVTHPCNSCTQKTKAGEAGVEGQSELKIEKESHKKPNKDTARSQPSANQGEASEETNSIFTLLL